METHERTDRPNNLKDQAPAGGDLTPEQDAQLGLRAWLIRNGPYLILIGGLFVYLFIKFDTNGLLAILKAALGLGLVIFIHELGHFMVAKWCDVHVETFSIGFGPALPGCCFKRGETTYMVALFPLGGYVKMVGEGAENEEDENDPRSFKNKSVGQRMAIISAGVIMNVILAAVCFVVVYTHGMKQPAGVIGIVESGGGAWEHGIPTGAVLMEVGEAKRDGPLFFTDLKSEVLRSRAGQKLKIVYRLPPDNKDYVIEIEPRVDKGAGLPMVGVSPPRRLTLLPELYRKVTKYPVNYGSPAANARSVGSLKPGDVIVAMTNPDEEDKITPLPEIKPGDSTSEQSHRAELAARWQKLADKPLVVQVRRKGAAAGSKPDEIPLEPAHFQFGESIVASTDPDHPDQVTPIPEDPRNPGSGQGDYFDFRRRMQRLEGRFVTLTAQASDGGKRDLMIPPTYHSALGARMRMGKVSGIRQDSSAVTAKVQTGDIIKQITLKHGAEKKNFMISRDSGAAPDAKEELIDPARLPYELRKWAADRKDVKAIITVLRDNKQNPYETVTLEEVPWDSRWLFDREIPINDTSPMPIPELGLAYKIETKVEEVAGSTNEDDRLKKDDVIVAVRFRQPTDEWGKSEPGKEKKLQPDQWAFVFEYLQRQAEFKEIILQVERNKEIKEIKVTAQPDQTWPLDDRGFLFDEDYRIQKADRFGAALVMGMEDTYQKMRDVYEHIRGMATGRISPDNLGGPITIARVAYNVAGADFWTFLFLMGMISVNLAVINFMPIPVLDGGHMVFLIYEKLRGKPAPESVRVGATYVGLALIASLMIFVFYLDFKRFF